MNDRLRREGTRALAACAKAVEARLLVQQSVVWVARPPNESFFDEDAPPHPDETSRSAHDREEIAREAGERYGFNVAVLRCGWFYGHDAAHTRMFAEGLRKRRMPVIGSGDAIGAYLHLDDASDAFAAAVASDRSGLWHVVDNEGVRVGTFLRYFADRLNAPSPLRAPRWLARVAAGSHAVRFVTVSSRTSDARFAADFEWAPRIPTYCKGIDQVVRAWEDGPSDRVGRLEDR